MMPYGMVHSIDSNHNSPIIIGVNFYHPAFLWDAATGKALPDLNFHPIDVALSPDGKRLAAAGSSLVTLWNVADLEGNTEQPG